MHLLLSRKNLVIAGLGAAVIGLGTVVAVDHTAGATPTAAPASLSASTSTSSSSLAFGELASAGKLKSDAYHVFDFLTTDTRLTWQQIGAAVVRGETLAQIAGANAAKVERDALSEVKAGLELGVVKGAITQAQEARLVIDARDAISALMAARLSALLPSGG
jgi:hypothetical protein